MFYNRFNEGQKKDPLEVVAIMALEKCLPAEKVLSFEACMKDLTEKYLAYHSITRRSWEFDKTPKAIQAWIIQYFENTPCKKDNTFAPEGKIESKQVENYFTNLKTADFSSYKNIQINN